MMDFNEDYNFHEEMSQKMKLKTFEIWHNRIFKGFKRPLRIERTVEKKPGEPKKIIHKLITAIGTVYGNGTVDSTALEHAFTNFQVLFLRFKENRNLKKQKKREKESPRKTKIMKFTKSGFRKAFRKTKIMKFTKSGFRKALNINFFN